MSWAVGWDTDHDRWMGYGVPAYCDVIYCGNEIDRGLGWRCQCSKHPLGDPLDKPNLFVCAQHLCDDVDEDDLPPEHPDWVNHLLTDESWAQWRSENPLRVERLSAPETQ